MNLAMDSCVGPRDNLEDAVLAVTLSAPNGQPATLLAVCDGVGGHNAGEVASATALVFVHAALLNYVAAALAVHDPEALAPTALAGAMTEALKAANEAVLAELERRPECQGMATTVVCAVIVNDTVVFGWAGDSRGYVASGDGMRQVTQDHSVLREQIERGWMTPKEARDHPSAHTITRYLGQPQGFEPGIRLWPLRSGDIVLLCTDGLTDVVEDHALEAMLTACRRREIEFKQVPRILVAQALDDGTQDNATVLCYQHSPAPVLAKTLPTLTADYPSAVAQALQHFGKENGHGRQASAQKRPAGRRRRGSR